MRYVPLPAHSLHLPPPLSTPSSPARRAKSPATPANMSISVMSFNVRYDNPDEAPEDKWDVRKPVCAEIIAK